MTKFSNLKVGEKLSESQFYSVEKIAGEKVQLVNDHGERIVVTNKYVETCLTSASQFTETKNINRTEAAQLLVSNPSVVMTVNYNKQVKESDVVKEIQEAYENSTPKEFTAKLKKSVKKGLEGEERTMIGRHYGTLDEFGRVQFIDMEIEKDGKSGFDNRQRLVDPRTLNFVILRGIKYIVK